MSRLLQHAIQELGDTIDDEVLELLLVFGRQGHTGYSAPFVINLFSKLALFEPVSPLTGEDEEWREVEGGSYQNTRCSHVFKDEKGAYDLEGKVFIDPDGTSWTSSDSRIPIEFPYTPKREYITQQDKGVILWKNP